MNRRTFLKDAAFGGAALGAGAGLFGRMASAAAPPDLAIIQGDSPAAITRAAVETLGGMGRFVAKGDVVLIKPNIGWDRTPEMAACTNPDVVRTLVELSFTAGAKKVTVMDNTTNQAQRCYARSGIQEAAKAAGADVPFINPRRIKKMNIGGAWLKEWDVIQDFVECDALINVPIAKHHSLCRVTLGMKNWLGAIADPRNRLHQRIDEASADLAAFFKPKLTVLDAYRILVRNGPQGGRPSDTRLLKTSVAGADAAAVEAMGATFFDIPPADLPLLQFAVERKLGRIDLEKLVLEKRTV
ncbi:MAG: DUF362 domain-containing protein [Candidatus Aminicenantes bacterium]|nr:DUF362 domain-containing protein [Candidatus Aminicenantes bacterium]